MKRYFTFCLIVVLSTLAARAEPDYDKARFEQIQTVINSSTNKLLGKSLDEVSDLLSLKGVPWDTGYTSYPLGEARIYHFRGFYLYLHLEILPKDVTPSKREGFSYTEPELRKNGVRWLAAFDPFVHEDGLTNRAERMTNYWVAVDAGFKKRNEEMKRFESRTNK